MILPNPFRSRAYNLCHIYCGQLLILFWNSTGAGRVKLAKILKLCSPLTTKQNVTQLQNWLSETWVNLAMGKLECLRVAYCDTGEMLSIEWNMTV